METNTIIYLILSYLIGATPIGLLVAKSRGINIREVGSCNIGATNVFRCVGKGWGLLTFFIDALKGWFPATLLAGMLIDNPSPNLNLMGGALAIAGHNWPVWLKFKGGKGVATSAGMLLGLSPHVVGCGLLAWILLMLTTRYVSVASMGAAITVGLAAWYFHLDQGLALPITFSIIALVIVIRHRSNISRLLKGNENRFSFKKKKEQHDS